MTDDPTPPEPAVEEPAPPPKKRGVKVVRHSLRAVWLLVSLPVLVLVVLAALLIGQDITAPSWVKSRVQDSAGQILAGGTVAFGQITLNVGRDLHPRVTLRDTVLRDADGALLAEVDEISGLMSPRGLILEHAALMQEVDLRGVALHVARSADGSVALAFRRDAAAVRAAPSITGLIERSETVFERPALQAMEQLRIADLSVIYQDARADQTWRISNGSAILDLRGGSTAIIATLPLHNGDVLTDIALFFESPHQSLEATVQVSVQNIAARDLARQSPALGWMAAIDAPLSGTITSNLDAQGVPLPLQATLDIGPGALRPKGDATPIGFERAGIALQFDPATNLTTFSGLDLQSRTVSFTGQGQAIAQSSGSGLPDVFVGQFAFADLVVQQPDLFEAPLDIASAAVDLRLTLDPFRIEVGQAIIADPRISLIAKGEATATPAGWQSRVDLHLDTIDSAALVALWPATLVPRTRKWVSENVRAATIHSATVGLRVAPGAAASFAAGFGFTDAEAVFMKTMPPVQGGAGYVSIARNRLAVTIDAGRVAAPQGGGVDIAGSSVVIADLRKKVDNRLLVNLETEGSITAALSLLDQEPMRVMSKADRPVTLADGRARLSGQITLPLGRRPGPGETQFDVTGQLDRVSSTDIVPGRRLAGSGLRVSASNTSLSFEGDVTLDGIPLSGRYATAIGPAANGQGEVKAQLIISPQALDVFNITLPPGSVGGRGRADLTLALVRGQAPQFTLSSSLRGITLALPPIGWSKAADAEGNLLVAGTLGPRPEITSLEVGGGGLTARGAITFNAGGGLERAQFSTVRLGNWLNAPITLRGRGPGRPVGVDINGGAIDLRRARFGSGGQDSGPMRIALDVLQITEGITLSDFRGDFDGTGGFSGQFQGRVNGAALVQGTVVPRNGRSAVRLVTNDAGGALRAAGFMRNAVGGTLDLTLLPATIAGTFDGNLAVRNLRVRDAPAIAALLDAISVVGLLQQLDGQGLSFEAVDAAFRLTPDQVIVTQSSATGPGLGISLDGIYTLASKSVDFQGVVSPFFLLNQIGSVLTRPGEGLIGFNFNITGTPANPAVSVNPLSVLTPGMFREIFRRSAPEVSR